jgi:hypothetical protein
MLLKKLCADLSRNWLIQIMAVVTLVLVIMWAIGAYL